MIPVLFIINPKIMDEMGGMLSEEGIPICIEVNLDLIAVAYDNEPDNLTKAITMVVSHEVLHVLLSYEGVPSYQQEEVVGNLDFYLFSGLKLNPNSWEILRERKKSIERDIAPMFA